MPYKDKEKKKKYQKEYRETNKDKISEQEKQYRLKNKEKIKEQRKRHYAQNKEKLREKAKQYRINNPEKAKQYRENNSKKIKEKAERQRINNPEYGKKYYQANKEKILKHNRQWRLENYKHFRKYQDDWAKNKRKTDLKFNLNCRMTTAMGISLKGNKNGRHWENLVGYTLPDLEKHLKSTMPEGYTWQDFLNGELHIDHIIPKSIFNFTKPEHADFKRCWALENLRLLPASENCSKRDKLYKPFQPALKIMVS